MYLFFDTETTGVPKDYKAPASDINNWPRLVQLGYLLYDNDCNLVAFGDHIIKPKGFDIPVESSKIHGITTEKAIRVGKSLRAVLEEFKIQIDKSEYIVAHNMAFDEKIIGAEFLRSNFPNIIEAKERICTMAATIDFCAIQGPYGYKWPKLSELHVKLFGKDFVGAHNAMVDVESTAKCFWELTKLGIINLKRIHKMKNLRLKWAKEIDDLKKSGKYFIREIIEDIDFENKNLNGAEFSHSRVKNCDFKNNGLKGANFRESKLINCEFRSSDLEGADFQDSDISKGVFFESNMENLDFSFATISQTLTNRTSIDSCSLNNTKFIGSTCNGIRISKSSFKGSNLNFCQFNDSIITFSDFSETILVNASMKNSNLSGCIFINADLRGADLTSADLSGCDFSNANLAGAILTDVIVSTQTKFDNSITTFTKKSEDFKTGLNIFDADGNIYTSVRIGSQLWLVENLKAVSFRNGDKIAQAKSKEEWELANDTSQPCWKYPKYNSVIGNKYGLQYNGFAVKDARGLLPRGWDIPSIENWYSLFNHLGGVENAACKLKAEYCWEENGTNEVGFNAFPLGDENSIKSNYASFWSSTEGIDLKSGTQIVPSLKTPAILHNSIHIADSWMKKDYPIRGVINNINPNYSFDESDKNNFFIDDSDSARGLDDFGYTL